MGLPSFFVNGYAAVTKDSKNGIINKLGNIIVEPKYFFLTPKGKL
ncbi:WG repeat-containing protein [Paenibacillus sp. YAF4_2]